MTRTPDEIKKGLEEEIPVHYHIDGEPRLTPRLLMDMQWLHKDALALIQQLQAENTEKDARIQQLEAERDAAVADIKQMVLDPYEPCFCDYCKLTEEECARSKCKGRSAFEWRGVQKD